MYMVLGFHKILYCRAANQVLRFALEGRLSLALEPPDYKQVLSKSYLMRW